MELTPTALTAKLAPKIIDSSREPWFYHITEAFRYSKIHDAEKLLNEHKDMQDEEIARAMLDYTDFKVFYEFQHTKTTILHSATKESNLRILDIAVVIGKIQNFPILEVRDATGATPFIEAVKSNKEASIDHLLSLGASIHVCDSGGSSALLWAVRRAGHELVRRLLLEGADVNQACRSGMRPLHAACDRCDPNLVQMLLTAGADPLGVHPAALEYYITLRAFVASPSEGGITTKTTTHDLDLLLATGSSPYQQRQLFITLHDRFNSISSSLTALCATALHHPRSLRSCCRVAARRAFTGSHVQTSLERKVLGLRNVPVALKRYILLRDLKHARYLLNETKAI